MNNLQLINEISSSTVGFFFLSLFVCVLFFSMLSLRKGCEKKCARPKASPFHVERKEFFYSTEQKNIWVISVSIWNEYACIYL